jgi:membrane-associated phospholipid phosphatase
MTGSAQVSVMTVLPTPPARESRAWAWRQHVRPEECLFVIFTVALIVLVIVTGQWEIVDSRFLRSRRFAATITIVTLFVLFRGYIRAPRELSHLARWKAGGRLGLQTLREFGPLFFCLGIYEALHDLTPILRPHVEDHLLVASDHFFLHVNVGIWLDDHIGSPAMTHVMTFCYVSYAFASPIYAGLQYVRGRYRAFHDFALAITITAFLGYSGYLLLPAVGPYVYQHAIYSQPLPGWGHGGLLDVIAKMKGSARDAFPSLHTAMTTVVLGMMWRDARKLFWAYLPVALGLYVSTMYLREHYATDVAAGFVVGFTALAIAPKINRWWYDQPATTSTLIPAQLRRSNSA